MDQELIDGMDTISLLTLWGNMLPDVQQIEAALIGRIEATEANVECKRAKAEFKEGRGSYDYPAIATALRIPAERLVGFTKNTPKIDYNAACEDFGMNNEIKEQFRVAGKSSVKLTLLKQKG